MLYLLQQIFKFLRVYRKFWMAPIIVGLLLLGSLVIASQSTTLAPFIYAIF